MRSLLLLLLLSTSACGGSVTETPSPTNDASGDSTSDSSTDGSGSCTATSGCSATQWCKLDKTCGSKNPGTCMPRPASCTPSARNVCGANGTVYPGECAAQLHGVDLSDTAPCSSPVPGEFRCGSLFCNAGEYCVTTGNDAPMPGQPCETSVCTPLPTACTGKTDCSCFPSSTACVSMCKYESGGFHITCLGG